MSKEQLSISPDNIVTPGERRHFWVNGIDTDRNNSVLRGSVERVVEGGFYGQTIVLNSLTQTHPDFVVKTTEPGSPTKKIGRMANWDGKPFPPQYLEAAAQLDHLSSRIIHLAIPEITGGRVISPDSFGYTTLGSLGHAQVLERMRGRGARFDTNTDENGKLEAYRKLIWRRGVQMGLESTAQIHPDNPFGKPNVWLAEDGRVIWLDTLPAIPHKEWVFPYYWPPSNVFKFDFHRDVRDRFNSSDPTFNKIHTDQFRKFLDENQIVTSKEEEIRFLLDIYDDRFAEYEEGSSHDTRSLIIQDSLKRGLIDRAHAKELTESDAKYALFVANQYLTPMKQAATDVLTDSKLTSPFFDPEARLEIKRFIHDPKFREHKVAESTYMRGVDKAYRLGLISQEEWEEAWQLVANQDNDESMTQTYVALSAAYYSIAVITNTIENSLYASALFSENPALRIAQGAFFGLVVPSIARVSATAAISKISNKDLSTVLKYSAWPKLGTYISIPLDIKKRYGEQSELIWHYSKRMVVASLSGFMKKWGGWNTDHEERLWNTLKADKR